MIRETFKIFGIQLGIFLLYQSLMYYFIRVLYISHARDFELIFVLFHWLILLVLMIIFFAKKKKGKGFGYLLSFIVIFIIGLGTCTSLYFGNLNEESKEMVDSIRKADSIIMDSIQMANKTF